MADCAPDPRRSGLGRDAAGTATVPTVSSPERTFVLDHLADLHADLDAWLRIPSISADPAHAPDVADSAAWLAEALRRTGFPTVEIWPTAGAPAVFAEWPSADAGAPVALVYGHHDVQPVDPPELWVHPPFEPTVIEGPDGPELHARGAIDDKGNVAFHLLGMRAHLAATGRDTPAVTVKLLIEGEEESGSPNFAALLKERTERLACDVVVVSDTGMAGPDLPSAVTSMRGLADAELTLRGPAVDLHSGSFGGAVPNPLHALAQLIATLHDDRGRVTLPGFYDKVRPLSDRERELMARVPFDEQEWLAGPAASRAAVGEAGFSTLERIGARPTAEVNGMWGGYTGPGHKTIVPAEAYAKLTFRLVSGQRPEDVGPQLRAWVEANLPEGIEAEVHTPPGGVSPCASDLDSPWMDALLSSIAQAWDGRPEDVLFMKEGGSGPEADLVEILGAPLIFLGAGLPTDRIHSPNERVLLSMLHRGAEAAAHLWRELATVRRA
jgi:acetylornithine deacetylase/succinyl-diaminopimelate desuccinylase-like protein